LVSARKEKKKSAKNGNSRPFDGKKPERNWGGLKIFKEVQVPWPDHADHRKRTKGERHYKKRKGKEETGIAPRQADFRVRRNRRVLAYKSNVSEQASPSSKSDKTNRRRQAKKPRREKDGGDEVLRGGASEKIKLVDRLMTSFMRSVKHVRKRVTNKGGGEEKETQGVWGPRRDCERNILRSPNSLSPKKVITRRGINQKVSNWSA